MAFRLPAFNLTCGIHTGPGISGPLRLTSRCNLAWGERINAVYVQTAGVPSQPLGYMCLLLPPLTDIRGILATGGQDYVEVPIGSGRWYAVQFVDDIGKGFANEHRGALLIQDIQPTPLP
jgi:hypothetical protein